MALEKRNTLRLMHPQFPVSFSNSLLSLLFAPHAVEMWCLEACQPEQMLRERADRLVCHAPLTLLLSDPGALWAKKKKTKLKNSKKKKNRDHKAGFLPADPRKPPCAQGHDAN